LISPGSLFRKTPKGAEEIETRRHKLAPRLRSVLLLVTDARTAAELRGMAKAIGSPDDFLEQLVGGGFIEATPGEAALPAASAPSGRTPAERFIAAHRFMDSSVVTAGGLRSYLFQLKLSKCGSMEELHAILPDYGKFMATHLGEAGAQLYLYELKSMLD
jgi:hypothetical protein